MYIDSGKLSLAMARACVNITDLRDVVSSATLARIQRDPNRRVSPKVVGKIASRLKVDVTEIVRDAREANYDQSSNN